MHFKTVRCFYEDIFTYVRYDRFYVDFFKIYVMFMSKKKEAKKEF